MKQLILFLIAALLINISYTQNEHKEYYENGNLMETGQYNEDGKATGEWKIYHENGRIKGVGKYENGKMIGRWRYYNENGKLSRP